MSRIYRGLPSSEQVDWKLASDLYYAEKLVEAYDTAMDTGMGVAAQYLDFFRTIEAEYLTATRSTVQQLQQNLELEYIPDEVEAHLPTLINSIQSATNSMSAKLSYGHDSPTRFTVLAAETDAPWLHGRWGYCIQKKPFYKICLPLVVLPQPQRLQETLLHEYAHVAVGTIADRRAPRWLNEAVAQTVSGEARNAPPPAEWLSPKELEGSFAAPQTSQERRNAYLQAAWIGAYLAEQYGEEKLGDLLRGFSDNSILQELWLRISGESPDQEALQQTYKLNLKQLFENARAWVEDHGTSLSG
jgi:hypothetical protein